MSRKGIPLISPVRVFVLAMSVLFLAANSMANPPEWAKKGVSFRAWCDADKPDDLKECQPLRIVSPDGKSAVEVSYKPLPDHPDTHLASLRVTTVGRDIGEVQPVASVEDEITWSPDSKAFFMNGNENADNWDLLAVHMLDDPHLGPGYIDREVKQDMVRSFPPCQADPLPVDDCAELAAEPDDYIGVLGLDWIGNSSRMVVMTELPCSSRFGGIMCQVLGYEIEVPSGKILRRMKAKEFARRWQHSMAWKFSVPDPPTFKTKSRPNTN
jgi:hypothetical protein